MGNRPRRRRSLRGRRCSASLAINFLDLYAAGRHGYDRGDYDAEEYWARIARAAGGKLSSNQLAQLRQVDVAMWSNVRPAMLRWVERLRAAGLRTAVLSNMHDDMVQRFHQNADWTVNFDCLTLSSAIRMAKPDAEIFWHCLQRLDVTPHEALFIDDREPNVRTAQSIGITGIAANSPAQLRAQLAAIGFAPLPE